MKGKLKVIVTYFTVIICVIVLTLTGNRIVTTTSYQAPIHGRTHIIIDAGHGGIDSGATSISGVLESKINLEIALRLNDLMHLLGISTIMTRTDDRSIYTHGQTIAAQKVSDLKERVRIVNDTDKSILISIHQNTFSDSRYRGAQVFHASGENSQTLAQMMQTMLITTLNPDSKRNIKKATGIYLLENIKKTGVLIECGFISNPEEESLLRDPEYQKKVSAVIATVCSQYLDRYDA